ncbi:MAG: PAS domain S-box protein [Promethearchaeota archaeon]
MEDETQLITELKSKIKDLNQKNNNLESSLLINNTLIDNLPILFMLMDTEGYILSLNEVMAKSLGNKKEDIIGKNVLDYFPPKVADFRTKMAYKVINSKKPIIFEDKRDNKWFKTGLFPILDSKGNVVQIATLVEEITGEKTQLNESEEKFRMLSDQSLMGLGIIQGEKIKYVNDAITSISGYSKDVILRGGTKILTKIIYPKDRSFVLEQLQKKLAGDKDVIARYSVRIITKSGELKWVEIFSKTIKYEGKNADFFTFVDITEQKMAEGIIKESEEKYRSIFETSSEAIVISDINGKILEVNSAALEILGYDDKELIGAIAIPGYVYPEQRKLMLQELIKNGFVKNYELDFKKKDGSHVHVLGSATLLRNKEGKRERIIGIFSDISDRIKAEQKIKIAEEKLRNIIHHSDNLYYIHDTKQKITYVSPQSEKILGYTPDEMKIKWTTMITDNPMNEIGLKLTNKAITTGLKQDSYIMEAIRKDGEKILIRINESPLKDENGGVIGITGVLSDITELKRAESDIIRRKEYLQNVIDSASEVIFTIDSDFKIRTWNKTAEQITGYNKKRIVDKSIKQVELFDYPSEFEEYIKAINNKKTATLNEISINTIYGIARTFSVSPSFIKDESENIIEFLFVCRDITKEKKLFGKIQSGTSYLIQELDNNTVLDIFNFQLESKKHGLYIGRIPNKEIQTCFKNNNPKIIKLTAQKDDRYPTSYSIEELYQKIKDFIKNKNNAVILIDRVGYLIINYSFESVMKTLYRINDLIQKHNSILLLRVNPSILNQNQIAILNEDFKKIPSQKISDIQISQELYEILTYIQNESKNNITVRYGNIGKTFSISKVTAKKRLESLIEDGLIYSRKQGKSKILNITEKGKNLLKHKST